MITHKHYVMHIQRDVMNSKHSVMVSKHDMLVSKQVELVGNRKMDDNKHGVFVDCFLLFLRYF